MVPCLAQLDHQSLESEHKLSQRPHSVQSLTEAYILRCGDTCFEQHRAEIAAKTLPVLQSTSKAHRMRATPKFRGLDKLNTIGAGKSPQHSSDVGLINLRASDVRPAAARRLPYTDVAHRHAIAQTRRWRGY